MIPTRPSKRIPKGSPFAFFRHYPRVGQEPYVLDIDDLDEVEPFPKGLPEVQLPDDHPAKRFVGRSQNDAVVLDPKVEKDVFELTVNHYDVERLATTLQGKPINWDVLGTVFPVTYRFEGVSEFHVLRAVEHGALQHFRSGFRRIRSRLFDVRFIHVTHFTNSAIRCILLLNGRNSFSRGKKNHHTAYHNSFYLCVEAANLTIVDRHRQGWLEYFGPEQMAVLDRFESVWPVPDWALPDFENFLATSSGRK